MLKQLDFFWYTHHANAEHDKSSILFLSNYKEHLILMNIFKLLLNLVLQTISKQYNCSFQWQKSILIACSFLYFLDLYSL